MIQNELRDYRGVFHVHSKLSDGTADLPEIAASARQAGLNFVGLADHEPRGRAFETRTGWSNGVLLLGGKEISHHRGHYLAFGPVLRPGLRKMPLRLSLAELKRRGALTFVAHPLGLRKPLFRINARRWSDWAVNGFTGLEIWSYMLDWTRELRVSNMLRLVYNPTASIAGPARETMRIWDGLCRTRRVVAIAGLDTHGSRPLPGPLAALVKGLPDVIRYEKIFATIRTHVLAPPLTGTDEADVDILFHSLAEGLCYSSFDELHDGTGFSFIAEGQGRNWLMGKEITDERGELLFRAQIPASAHITLLRDGQVVAQSAGRELLFQTSEPGVYRVEARLLERPWIFSNPIYWRPAGKKD